MVASIKTYYSQGLASIQSVASASTGKLKLRIRFPRSAFNGKVVYLRLGLDDTPENRAIAERKIALINSDLLNDDFDQTLERYKPKHKKAKTIALLQTVELPKINDLYRVYIESKREFASPNTYKLNYLHWLDRLNKIEDKSLLEISSESAIKLLEYLEPKYTNNANKRLFDQLNACVKWAISTGKIKFAINPYSDIRDSFAVSKKKRKTPDAFTKEEIAAIFEAFKEDYYYNHYTNYVVFLFATGARPSEVICLTWKDIDDRFIHFSKRLIETVDGKKIEEGLKAEDERKFPINAMIKGLLADQKKRTIGELIFPSPTGQYIHIRNFSRRAWKRILEKLELKYKRPYTTRASFITHTLEHLDAKDVGRLCGNLPETIYRHYASSNISHLNVPDII